MEQQIGRVDPVSSHRSAMLEQSISISDAPEYCPFIKVRAIIFAGTYDAENWRILRERWTTCVRNYTVSRCWRGLPAPTPRYKPLLTSSAGKFPTFCRAQAGKGRSA